MSQPKDQPTTTDTSSRASGTATTTKPPVRVKIGHAKIGHAATPAAWIRASIHSEKT